ncbi:MAG TPA: hypothetical protein VGK93_00025, partial [Candidatus Eisenbacteria bacterium]
MSTTDRRGLPENPGPGASSGVPVSEILAALPRTGPEGIERVGLEPVVAAALRTAVDFLAGEARVRRPLVLSHDEAVLELRCDGIDPAGIEPASELLEPVGGNLGPIAGGGGAWLIRVPVVAPRGTYLMLEQGMLPLAVPWHSVLQVRMVPAVAIASLPRQHGYPVLSPLARGPREGPERPVVLVGLGLKRAFLVADRLVWRLPAETLERSDSESRMGLSSTVQTAEGEVFWVAEPAFLLREVEPPSAAELLRDWGAARPPAAEPHRPSAPRPTTTQPLIELGREHVEPLGQWPTRREVRAPAGLDPSAATSRIEPGPTASGMVGPEPSAADVVDVEPPATAPVGPEPGGVATVEPAPVPRRALVAEDSISGRIFLWRLLEQQGFEVHTVTTAAQLEAARQAGPWALVCADVELPDSRRA